jgi:hypothetical protein
MKNLNEIMKWVATAVLIVGSAVNGLGYYPAGPLILVAGGVIWMVIALRVRDWALVTTNAVMGAVGLATVIYTMTNLDPRPEGSAKADEYYSQTVDDCAK